MDSTARPFTVRLTPEEVAALERFEIEGAPGASLEDELRHLLQVAIGDEQNLQDMQDDPPPSIFGERIPF